MATGVRATFAAFVDDAEASLLRTAYLLTGGRRAAEELLTAALAETYGSWRRACAGGDPGAAVRRAMVRRALGRRATALPAAGTPDDGLPPPGVAAELRRALLVLPPRTRAALVLRLHDGLTEAQTADDLGCPPGAVAALTEEAAAALRAVLPAGPVPLRPAVPAAAPDAPLAGDEPDAIYRRPG